VRAVDDVSFSVAAGEVVGVAGPNGAGKSTLIATLLGFLPPTDGEVRIDGRRPREFVEHEGIAYLPELMTLPLTWRAAEALHRLAALSGIPRATRAAAVERVMAAVEIGEHRGKRLKALSKGNLQRLGLAQALLVDRRVVVFDEPTHGLDPVWTSRFREIAGGLRAADRAILIASHNLDELERLCDRVVIIDRGRVQRIVDMHRAETSESASVRQWRIRVLAGADALAARLPGVTRTGDTLECTADVATLNRALADAIGAGALVGAVVPAESALEHAFHSAVGTK
jgi:ABC-2 type transport system ATP-binding protein